MLPVTSVAPIKSRGQPSYSARCVSHPNRPFNPEIKVENPTAISPIAAWIFLNSLIICFFIRHQLNKIKIYIVMKYYGKSNKKDYIISSSSIGKNLDY